MKEFFANWTHLDSALLLFSQAMSALGLVTALILFQRIRATGRTPGGTIAWVLAMIFIPYLAIPLFLLIGGRKFKKMAGRKRTLKVSHNQIDTTGLGDIGKTMVMNLEGSPPATTGNRMEILADGVADYQRMMELIASARKTIHFQTYILSNDDVGRAIIAALTKRAMEGVTVRLLLDAVGCHATRISMVGDLKKAGGKVGIFMPVHRSRFWAANLRNHRKIYIFDEEVAILGGRNIGAEYIGPDPDPKRWMDFAIMLEGPAMLTLNEVFAADWEFATGEPVVETITRTSLQDYPAKGDITVQTVASGPDVDHDLFYESLLSAIFLAKKRLWIATPYFIPDDTLLRILTIAAHMGRDVRLVIPKTSDHYLIDFARGYGIRQLSEAGGKVLLYQPSMLHTKLFIIDDDVCSMGSANMDMRSLYLNYEIAVYTYNREFAKQVEGYMMNLFENSILLSKRERRKMRNFATEMAENLSYILSPLL
ncbi:cardiolipin synthase [Candidatus Sumerlaeota bacterium]|nr:cardiolipin synthase [Candidatus Sumerlaeota bacterium]